MPGKNIKEGVSDLHYRALPLSISDAGVPTTLDEATRSVEVIGATEAPVPIYDWERGETVNEILLMTGCQLPENRQNPLLDTHSRYDTAGVIGSFRGMAVQGDKLIGRAFFSTATEAEAPYLKVREGHLTDFSVGYRVLESLYVPAGVKQVVAGRTFDGPVKIATKWVPKEMSVCPIGADEQAKARSAMTGNKIKEEETVMDKKVREFLEGRGLPQSATEEEAYSFMRKLDMPKETPAGGIQTGQIDEAVRAAVRAEQERTFDIRAMCDMSGCSDMADGFIKDNKSVDEARKAVFAKVIESKQAEGGVGFRVSIEMGADGRDKFRSAAQDALIIRSGESIEKPVEGARDLVGFSLREMARECLRVANQPVNGNPMEMVGRALTSSDFPILLANTANRFLFDGYTTAEETWPTWCEVGSVSDFKTNTSGRASETDDLDEIKEDDEYKYGKMTEAKEEYKIATYGKLFQISRQAIINDDLGAMTDIPRKHGEAAARKIGDIVYAVPVANAAMGDGIALFYATHGNIGTGGVPSETTIAEAIKLMKLQKDLNGKRRLNITPQFFIAPVSLEGVSEVFFNSGQFAGSDVGATRVNPYAGNRFKRVYEPRLDDASTTAYYLAGPKGKTIKVFFLNGNQSPYLETKQGWSVDGVEYKVRIDAGAKAMDWKALVKNAGA